MKQWIHLEINASTFSQDDQSRILHLPHATSDCRIDSVHIRLYIFFLRSTFIPGRLAGMDPNSLCVWIHHNAHSEKDLDASQANTVMVITFAPLSQIVWDWKHRFFSSLSIQWPQTLYVKFIESIRFLQKASPLFLFILVHTITLQLFPNIAYS